MEEIKEFEFLEPPALEYGGVYLKLEQKIPADREKGFVPVYRFGVYLKEDQSRTGHISFKVGDNDHIILYAGHIGYEIEAKFRGRSLAVQACLAIRNFVKVYYQEVIITCDPDNVASIKTIEKIGGRFIETYELPEGHHLRTGKELMSKNRYFWKVLSAGE